MKLGKNIIKSVSFSVITILFLSLSYITIYSSLSTYTKFNTIVLSGDFSSEKENSDSEKDFSEEYLDLFIIENQKLIGDKYFKHFPIKQSSFLIPRVFYDIQILPPEVQVS
ncbi:MAG: hypothetical protein U0W65_04830 [Bacteroidia bacterium]|nr:hypothetical protein [Bacteroidia bacterium]